MTMQTTHVVGGQELTRVCSNCGTQFNDAAHRQPVLPCPNCGRPVRIEATKVTSATTGGPPPRHLPPPVSKSSRANQPPPVPPTPRPSNVDPLFAIAAFVGFLAVCLIGGLAVALVSRSRLPTPNSVAATTKIEKVRDSRETVARVDESMANMVERVEPSVVWIVLTGKDGQSVVTGSGFVVDDEGWIATNYHVVEDAARAVVYFQNRRQFPVEKILVQDESKDLAIVTIRAPQSQLRALPLATVLPRKGEDVATFGAPLCLPFTISDGVISAVRSGAELNLEFAANGMDLQKSAAATWLQTTAPISHGSSGGPLVNMRGEVVGVNTLAVNGELGQNLNFAISSLDLRNLLQAANRKAR